MGFVYQRGNRFWIRYRDAKTRKLRRESAGTTELEAFALLSQREGDAAPGLPLYRVLSDYLAHLNARAKVKSRKVARSSVKHLLGFFGKRDAASLTSRDVDAFALHRRSAPVSAKTVNNDLVVLRAALRLAGLKSPVRLLRVPRKRVLPLLDSSDLARLYMHAREPYRGILFVSAHTGFRLSEMSNDNYFCRSCCLTKRCYQPFSPRSHRRIGPKVSLQLGQHHPP